MILGAECLLRNYGERAGSPKKKKSCVSSFGLFKASYIDYSTQSKLILLNNTTYERLPFVVKKQHQLIYEFESMSFHVICD